MMSQQRHTQDLASIKARGSQWMAQFAEIGFVGELDIPEHEIDALALSVGKYVSRARWDDEVCSTLAVLVVNLAYYSPTDIDEGFRWHVLHKLFGHPLHDVNLWQDEIGGPILRLLSRHFSVKDLPGPFRYVRPVMLQAGVPEKLGGAFANFFIQLVKTYGLQFSEADYREGCEKITLTSGWLKSFLQTNGWNYCREVARILSNVEKGIFSDSDVSQLLRRLRLTVQKIQRVMAQLPTVGRRSESLPNPKLILDRANLRLALEFSEMGLDGRYRHLDGTEIRSTRYLLRETDFGNTLSGKIIYPNGRVESWKISPWYPNERSWATFRLNDGSLERSSSDLQTGSLRAGRTLLAVPRQIAFPEQLIIEDLGELYLPGLEKILIRVFDCDLPAGFELPSIQLEVGLHEPVSSPTLTFGRTSRQLSNTTNVFCEELPEIKIINWTQSFADNYLLIQEIGGQHHRLPESLCRSQDTFKLRVNSSPKSGRVYVEPRGRTPNGFFQSSLEYVLLPKAKLTWPKGLNGPQETPCIEFDPPERFEVEWQQGGLESNAPGCWQVPSTLDFVSGEVVYDKSQRFYISGPIYRFWIQSKIVKQRTIWQDALKERSTISLSLSSNERGRRVRLGVEDEQGFFECINLGPVPSNCRLDVSTDAIRDAFQTRGFPAGFLAVRVDAGQTVRSDVVFLHDDLIRERVFSDGDDEFLSWFACVPSYLQHVICCVRNLSFGPTQQFTLRGLELPERLFSFLTFYEICSSVLDWGLGFEDSSTMNSELRGSLRWIDEARSYLDKDTNVSPSVAIRLLHTRPNFQDTLDKSKNTPRHWRNSCAELLRGLRGRRAFGDYKRLVKEWANHCRLQHWRAAKACRIGRSPGGQNLTEGAENYYYAFENLLNNRSEKSMEYFIKSKTHFESVRQSVTEGLVWEIASALRLMIFIHTQHRRSKTEYQELKSKLGSHWSSFLLSIGRIVGEIHNEPVIVDSLELGDITPHAREVEFDVRMVS